KAWLNGLPTPLLEQWSVDCWHGGMWVSFERCCDMEISPDTPGAYRGTSEGVGFNAACHTFFGNHNTYERCCLAEFVLVERKSVLYNGYLERVKTLSNDRRYLTRQEYRWFHDTKENKPPGFFSVPDEPRLADLVSPSSSASAAEVKISSPGARQGERHLQPELLMPYQEGYGMMKKEDRSTLATSEADHFTTTAQMISDELAAEQEARLAVVRSAQEESG
ncbi:unnamed protein product, partial [Amoebophrya sp. A120]